MLSTYSGLQATSFDALKVELVRSGEEVRFHAAMLLREGALLKRRGVDQPFKVLKQLMPVYWSAAGFNSTVGELCSLQVGKDLRLVEKDLLK